MGRQLPFKSQLSAAFRSRVRALVAEGETLYGLSQASTDQMLRFGASVKRVWEEAKNYDKGIGHVPREHLREKFAKLPGLSNKSIWSQWVKIGEQAPKLERFKRSLPVARDGLYELAKAASEGKPINEWIESGKLNPKSSVRSVRALNRQASYRHSNSSRSYSSAAAADDFEVLSIRFPRDSWREDFTKVEDELISFLKSRQIPFVYGRKVDEYERAEKRFNEKVAGKAFVILKSKVKKLLANYVEAQGSHRNLWAKRKQSNFKSKLKKLGLLIEEVDVGSCINELELKAVYQHLGDDEGAWNKLILEAHNEAMTAVQMPEVLESQQARSLIATELPQPIAKRRKLNFNGLKV